jgi:hypothetical protein
MLVELFQIASTDEDIEVNDQIESLCLILTLCNMTREYFTRANIDTTPGNGGSTKKVNKLK